MDGRGNDRTADVVPPGYRVCVSQQSWGQPPWSQPPRGRESAWGSPFGAPTQTRQTSWPPPQGPAFGAPYGQRYPGGLAQFPGPPQVRRRRGGCGRLLLSVLGIFVVLTMLPTITSMLTGSSTTTSSSTTADGPYQNEDYTPPPANLNPPPLPQPENYQQATAYLERNALYQQTVPTPVRCDLASINLTTASRSRLENHLTDLMGCLMRVWVTPVQQAGYQLPRPSVTVFDGSITTACGKAASHNAFYCAADQQVYYASDLPEVIPANLRSARFVVESVLAHEFGHAVQGRSGILISSMAWQQKEGQEAGKTYSRRLETQADCFAGQFLSSISASTSMTQNDLSNLSDLFYSIGDDLLTGKPNYNGEHGLGTNRRYWSQRGLADSSISTCNTFTAPANRVR